MKILQINSVSGIGSTGRMTTSIHNLLKKNDYESYIAYGRKEPLNKNNTIRIGTKFDNYLHVAKTRLLDQHGFGSKTATRKFIKYVDRLNPDVIHLHNLHGYYINIEILFKYLKETNKPIVWTLHDCWAFTGHCVHFEYAGCNCWTDNGKYACIQKESYPKSWIINNSKNNFKRKKNAFTGVNDLTIITPSVWLANLVKQSFLKEYPVKVINNGINLKIFKPVQSDFEQKNRLYNQFIILGVANVWDKKKGLQYFMRLSQYISRDSVIVLVGLNKEQLNNLPAKIIGIQQTDDIHELAEIYSIADVFVNPTLEDNFPTTNLEALACGTPVITFNTGGSGESVCQKCGYVIEQGNFEELVNKINHIKNQGKYSYTRYAVNNAVEKYNEKYRFKEYIDLYLQLHKKQA